MTSFSHLLGLTSYALQVASNKPIIAMFLPLHNFRRTESSFLITSKDVSHFRKLSIFHHIDFIGCKTVDKEKRVGK